MNIKVLFDNFCNKLKSEFSVYKVKLAIFLNQNKILEFEHFDTIDFSDKQLYCISFSTKTTRMEFFYPQKKFLISHELELKIREFINNINSIILSVFYTSNFENFPLPLFFLDENNNILGYNKIAKKKYSPLTLKEIEKKLKKAKFYPDLPIGYFKLNNNTFYFFFNEFTLYKKFYFANIIEMDQYFSFVRTIFFFRSFYHEIANKVNAISLLTEQIEKKIDDIQIKEKLKTIKNSTLDILTFFATDFNNKINFETFDIIKALKNIIEEKTSIPLNIFLLHSNQRLEVKFDLSFFKKVVKILIDFVINLPFISNNSTIYLSIRKGKKTDNIFLILNLTSLFNFSRKTFQKEMLNYHKNIDLIVKYNNLLFLLRKLNTKMRTFIRDNNFYCCIPLPVKIPSNSSEILLIMGDSPIVKIIGEILNIKNLSYKIINSYKQAFQYDDFSEYNFVFIDIDIPNVDFSTILSLLEKKKGNFIIFSSEAENLKKDFPENKRRKFIQKPFRLEELIAIIDDYT